MFKIVTVPNKVLTSPNKDVVKFDAKLKKIIINMEETLITQVDPEGVGLAAPQVGLNLNLFIIKPKPNVDTEVFINPKITQHITRNTKHKTTSTKKTNSSNTTNLTKKPIKTPLEGCLSIPRIWGPVKRLEKILVQYQDINGVKKSEWFADFKAVIIQHEMDHLQGILFTQRVIEQKNPLYEEKGEKLKKIEV